MKNLPADLSRDEEQRMYDLTEYVKTLSVDSLNATLDSLTRDSGWLNNMTRQYSSAKMISCTRTVLENEIEKRKHIGIIQPK